MRQTGISRDLMGACYTCHGSEAYWFGANTQGVAARHHDATGHTTWVDVHMHVSYGPQLPADFDFGKVPS